MPLFCGVYTAKRLFFYATKSVFLKPRVFLRLIGVFPNKKDSRRAETNKSTRKTHRVNKTKKANETTRKRKRKKKKVRVKHGLDRFFPRRIDRSISSFVYTRRLHAKADRGKKCRFCRGYPTATVLLRRCLFPQPNGRCLANCRRSRR